MSGVCYVCNKNPPNLLVLVKLKTQYSQKSFIEIINEILDDFTSRRQIHDASNCICVTCFGLIQGYDLHSSSAEARKQMLRKMLVKAEDLNLKRNKNTAIKRTYEKMSTNEANPTMPKCSNSEPDKIIRLSAPNGKLRVLKMVPKPNALKPIALNPTVSKPETTEPNKKLKLFKVVFKPNAPKPVILKPPMPEPMLQEPELEKPIKLELMDPILHTPKPMEEIEMSQSQCVTVVDPPKFPSQNVAKYVERKKPNRPKKYRKKCFQAKCDICDRKFVDKKEFKKHQEWHQRNPGWCCSICSFLLSDKESLLSHEKLHVGRPKLECVICGKMTHKIRSHTEIHGEKRYICEYCGKGFTTEYAMQGHQKFHTKEWKGECDTCGHVCYARNNLVAHLKLHLNRRPYTCSHCGFSFKRRDNLRIHERRHTEDTKTLKCTMCSAKFEHKFYLKQHMQRKHQIENLTGAPFVPMNGSQ
ncbi:zinc finger protein 449-like [Sitodiplosis mosellana]|uniref:zinc finger protein 449-like n=1 Tax=Sitodiplosis mosellana TaxID=263140 RepID=UPI002443ABA6|nr:zinc finger protein 449-like [Sitodiplosis mosellana]